ncbi:MAG: hypothetical protein A3E83_06305 [Gammaproteobacteria bacterium RIFCSPHIGHO2_12_FULL_41_20]|nr:MAG: hypothetical protein A3E83_06305 [Gammaproteobacteria bacterium RIFCSPHIGHO2_12_FULL_41_20]
MPLNLAKIQRYREENSIAQRTASLSVIENLDAEISIPVIIKILEDILPLVSEQDTAFADTRTYIEEAIKKLRKTDEEQNTFNVAGVFIRYRNQGKMIIDEMSALVEKMKKIKVTKETVSLWTEVALWLEGLYKHIYNFYKKKDLIVDGAPVRDKDGIKTCDWKDGLFKSIVGLTKWDIGVQYYKLALAIQEQLRAYQQMTAPVAMEVEVAVARLPTKPRIEETITIEDDGVSEFVIIRVPRRQASKARKLIEQLQSGMADSGPEVTQIELTGSELPDMLSSVKECELAVQIKTLQYAMSCAWTSHQTNILARFYDEIMSTLEQYRNDRYSFLFISIPRSHDGLAADAEVDLGENKTKPIALLRRLFKLREELMEKNSKHLLPKVNALLTDVIHMLRELRPQPILLLRRDSNRHSDEALTDDTAAAAHSTP